MRPMDHSVLKCCLFSLLLLTVSAADPPSNAAILASEMTPGNASNTANAGQAPNTSTNTSNTASTNQPSNTATSSRATTPSCTTRRCLASMLIAKEALSQPQSPSCISNISVPLIVYETLSVDTKDLRFESHLQVMLSWEDPDLSWDTSVYHHDMVVLPVSKIWTPELHVTNGVQTTIKHSNKDLLVHSNGTIEHMVIMNTVVGCEVNLYNYPFASDFCPIAINVWALKGCGMFLNFGNVSTTSANRGDWLTENVKLDAKGGRDDRNYLWVSLKMRSENPFLSLVLPSILIIVADVVSFSLPLGGGERISFKVTLVLSFIMFLIILNDLLPGGGQCSPIIRKHFCFCLVILVLSTLQSMVLTRLAKCGTLWPCSLSKSKDSLLKDTDNEEESKSDIKASAEEKNTALQKVVKFLNKMAAQDQKNAIHHRFANKVDLICFCIYLTILIVYAVVILYFSFGSQCKINQLDFWS
ncbi:5-hydroxytryptamine receptor 3A-like isoform X1 [Oncorhynchus tshawytscha]|uniref:5-hydroxytryptamine receptor 3A-like n=2 Tax=Oncorhynchus tshawytscha TaxID=74940 RepID=A0AAZ3S6Z1_ONCTS|nr:5-hydroxytryptamine receptor 3A-like isoform X1 [Oncorhynchus tshawytscha]